MLCSRTLTVLSSVSSAAQCDTHMATAWSATKAGLNCCIKSMLNGFRNEPASARDRACSSRVGSAHRP